MNNDHKSMFRQLLLTLFVVKPDIGGDASVAKSMIFFKKDKIMVGFQKIIKYRAIHNIHLTTLSPDVMFQQMTLYCLYSFYG